MTRMVVTACLILTTSIVLLFPVLNIEQAQQTGCCKPCATEITFADRVEGSLRAAEAAASALTHAAISSIRTLVCLGETAVEVYRVLNGPAADEKV